MLFAISCQYDTESSTPIQAQPEKKFTVKKLKFDEIAKNNALFDKVREFNKGKKIESNINGKIVYSTENDFYIDTNIATYIEDENGKISYTFKVFRNDSPYLLENIVLTLNDSLGFDLYFAQYDITQQELDQLKSGEAVNTSEKTMVFKITDNSFTNNLFNKAIMIDIGSGSCIIGQSFISGSLCGCDQHVYGASCTCPIQATPDQWITTWGSCPTEGGGGGGSGGGTGPDDPNNPTEPGSGCKGCGGDINTTPVFEETFEYKSPCGKIKNIKEKISTLSQSLLDLSNTTNQNHENGIFSDENVTSTTSNPVSVIPNSSLQGGSININLNPTSKYIMIGHTHDTSGSTGNGTYSIFSWDDLTTINKLIVNGHIKTNEFVFYVVTADNTRYAITIEDSAKLSNFFYDPSNLPVGTIIDPNKFKKMQDLFDKTYNSKVSPKAITNTSNKDDDKLTFLQFMKEADLGLQLFEIDNTFQTYTKLSINNNNQINYEQCD